MNTFKKRLLEEKKMLGTWIMSGSPVVTEVLACAGYDFLVIDAEHGLSSQQLLLHQTLAVQAHNVLPILRCPDQNPTYIKHALDIIGAETLMFPMVSTVQEAEKLVSACFYSPVGARGFAKMIRASQFSANTDYMESTAKELFLIAQLETEEAMNNAAKIGKVSGIDSVFIGPGDLAISMGISSGMQDASLKACVKNTIHACNKAGVCIGTVMPTPELALWFIQEGGDYVAIGGDLGFLFASARTQIAAFHSKCC